MVASDDPYGIVEFHSATPLNVSEDFGFVNLTVLRNGGSIGQLSVNYSVSSDTATEGADYESFGSGRFFFLTFPLLKITIKRIKSVKRKILSKMCLNCGGRDMNNISRLIIRHDGFPPVRCTPLTGLPRHPLICALLFQDGCQTFQRLTLALTLDTVCELHSEVFLYQPSAL